MLTTLACLLSLATPVQDPFQPERVAPGFESVRWHGQQPSNMSSAFESMGSDLEMTMPKLGSRGGKGLAGWPGHAALVLILPEPWNEGALRLGERLQHANADRGLVVATITRTSVKPGPESEADPKAGAEPTEGESQKRVTRGYSSDDEDPDARPSELLVAGFVDAESMWAPRTRPLAIVLGPSGEIVLAADPLTGHKALLEAMHGALNRPAALPLKVDLGEALNELQAEYFQGRWASARKAAEKLSRKLEKKDPETARAAAGFVRHVDQHEFKILDAVHAASGSMQGFEPLALLVAAIDQGFPKSDAAKAAEAAADAQRKSNSGPYRIAEEWAAALPNRPLLFPDEVDSKGKRFAKKLESALRLANFDGDLTRRMRALLLRFEAAGK